MEELRLDCRGLSCPQPVIRTRQSLEEMAGERLRVILDNEVSATNVMRFAQSQGHTVELETKEPGLYEVVIQKAHGAQEMSQSPSELCQAFAPSSTVVYVPSETMGRGDDELGRVLMAAYLDTLAQFAKEISHAIFINSGVKLVVEGSPVLEQIQSLERMGVQVLACGTCLNHFGIAGKLKVGVISNMMAILEVLSKAGRILTV